MDSLPTGPEYHPTAPSSAEARIAQLKRRLVESLFLRDGAFWEAVRDIRVRWDIQPQRVMPSEKDANTVQPRDKLPRRRIGIDDRRWHADLRSLKTRFVPDQLVLSGWYDFLGACVMCDPPDTRLLEFANFGRIYPYPLWPVVNCDLEDIDTSKVHSIIAPPIEFVWKRGPEASYEDGEKFAEYRIVVDEHTKEADVIHAFRGIKAAYGLRNRGGKPPMDSLTAIQCAVLYDDYNGSDPEDGRSKLWSYRKLATEFRGSGVRNERSAEEHVKRGRELRRKFCNP